MVRRYRSDGGMREASCCSERSSKSDGLWSSKVPWRADINSILEHREEAFSDRWRNGGWIGE